MVNIQDFGERIPGARKDLYAKTGIKLSDLFEIPSHEYSTLIRRDIIWPEDNYVDMVENQGYSARCAYIIKMARGIIPAKASFTGNVEAEAAMYTVFVLHCKNMLHKMKTDADIEYTLKQLSEACCGSFEYTDAETGEVLEGHPPGNVAWRTQYKFTDLNSDAIATECWLQNFPYKYSGALKGCRVYERRGTFQLVNSKGHVITPKEFSSREELGEFVHSGNLDAELNAKKDKKKVSNVVTVVRPQLEYIERIGPNLRNSRNAGPQHLMKQFSLRGGQFGNWNGADDRQACLNYAFDAFMDLAYALDLRTDFFKLELGHRFDEKQIGDTKPGMGLGIAFGARGHSRASAHYEPELHVINLTKMNGAGSLAHEMGHAIDYWLATVLKSRIFEGTRNTIRILSATSNIIGKRSYSIASAAGPDSLDVLKVLYKICKDMRETDVDLTYDEYVQFFHERVNREFWSNVRSIRYSVHQYVLPFLQNIKKRADMSDEEYALMTGYEPLMECDRVFDIGSRGVYGDTERMVATLEQGDLKVVVTERDYCMLSATPEMCRKLLAGISKKYIRGLSELKDGKAEAPKIEDAALDNESGADGEPVIANIVQEMDLQNAGYSPHDKLSDYGSEKNTMRIYGLYSDAAKMIQMLLDVLDRKRCSGEFLEELPEELEEFKGCAYGLDMIEKFVKWRKTANKDALYPVNILYEDEPTHRMSSFYKNALILDQGRREAYYGAIHEMFARAFEHYIEKRLTALHVKSQYLVHSTTNFCYFGAEQKPYPETEESKVLCKDFDALFAAMKRSGVISPESFGYSEYYDKPFVSYRKNIKWATKKEAKAPTEGEAITTGKYEAPDNKKDAVVAPTVQDGGEKLRKYVETRLKRETGITPAVGINDIATKARTRFGIMCGYVDSVSNTWKKETNSGVVATDIGPAGLLVKIERKAEPRKQLEGLIEGLMLCYNVVEKDNQPLSVRRLVTYMLCTSYGLDVRTYRIMDYYRIAKEHPDSADKLMEQAEKVLSSDFVRLVLRRND